MASIEKRSETSYRITVSTGYSPDGRKLFKKKTVSIDPNLTAKQREKRLNELAVLFEHEVETTKKLNDTQECFYKFLQMSGFNTTLLDAPKLQELIAGAQDYIKHRGYL